MKIDFHLKTYAAQDRFHSSEVITTNEKLLLLAPPFAKDSSLFSFFFSFLFYYYYYYLDVSHREIVIRPNGRRRISVTNSPRLSSWGNQPKRHQGANPGLGEYIRALEICKFSVK